MFFYRTLKTKQETKQIFLKNISTFDKTIQQLKKGDSWKMSFGIKLVLAH